jgi:hypothetical protein
MKEDTVARQRNNPKALKIIKDYIKICIELDTRIAFVSPSVHDTDLYGAFIADERKIYIYREAHEPITANTAFTVVHEVEHVRQVLANPGSPFWLHALGVIRKVSRKVTDKMENEADAEAERVLKLYGLRLPASCRRKDTDADRK